jgi:hypothetical protein
MIVDPQQVQRRQSNRHWNRMSLDAKMACCQQSVGQAVRKKVESVRLDGGTKNETTFVSENTVHYPLELNTVRSKRVKSKPESSTKRVCNGPVTFALMRILMASNMIKALNLSMSDESTFPLSHIMK